MAAKKAEKSDALPATKQPVAKKPALKKTAKPPEPPTKAPRKTAAKKSAAQKPLQPPPLDAIARAAYLNYRNRVENDLPGDTHGDWLEAERQLREGG